MSVKDCLELMRRFEAVEVHYEEVRRLVMLKSMSHTLVTQLRSHKEMGSEERSTNQNHKQSTRNRSQRNPVSGAKGKFIPMTSVQPRMKCANSVASKNTLSEPVSRKGDK